MKNVLFKERDCMDIAALALCLFALIFWAALLSYKFLHFGYYDWDLAFFSQAMWNLSHGGSGFSSLFDVNLFANHANLIAYFIIPLYKLFPNPLTLVFLKVFSYVAASFILYVLAKEKIGSTAALVFLFIYLIYIPNILGLFYEFDFESLSPAVLMLSYYFYVKDRWLGFLICAGALILIKENLPLIVLAFSIHGLFAKKDKIRWAIIPGALALLSFYLLNYVFIPYIAGRPIGELHPYYIAHNYKDLGGSVGGVIVTMVFHPLKIWHTIMTPVKLIYLANIFKPLLYLPLFSPGTLFLISPVLLQHLLSSAGTEQSVCFAYVLTLAPFVFISAVEALGLINLKFKKVFKLLVVVLLTINLTYFVIYFKSFINRYMTKDALAQTQETVNRRWELFHLIPKDAGVAASFSFLAPLSQRNNLYALYKIYDPDYQNDQYSYKLPSSVQYVLFDTQDPWLLAEKDILLARAHVHKFLSSENWVILKRYENFILFKRKAI